MTADPEPNDSNRHFNIDYCPLNTCREAGSLYPNLICATYKSFQYWGIENIFTEGLNSQDLSTKTTDNLKYSCHLRLQIVEKYLMTSVYYQQRGRAWSSSGRSMSSYNHREKKYHP